LEVQSVRCFVFEIILHTAYIVDACALASILPSLSLIDMTYFTVDTKATPASNYRFIWISLLHNVLKRIRNRTARFRCFRQCRLLWSFKELGEFS